MVTTDQRLPHEHNEFSVYLGEGRLPRHYEREERFVGLIADKESKELHR